MGLHEQTKKLSFIILIASKVDQCINSHSTAQYADALLIVFSVTYFDLSPIKVKCRYFCDFEGVGWLIVAIHD